MINVVFIMLFCVIVTDILGFWDEFSPIISRMLTKGKISKSIPSKLMTCSTCQTWWLGLLYIVVGGYLSIPHVLIVLLVALSARYVYDMFLVIEGLFEKVLRDIDDWFNN